MGLIRQVDVLMLLHQCTHGKHGACLRNVLYCHPQRRGERCLLDRLAAQGHYQRRLVAFSELSLGLNLN